MAAWSFGDSGAVRWVAFGEERRVAVEGCAGRPASTWHGVEGRKLAAVEVGEEVVVVVVAQV